MPHWLKCSAVVCAGFALLVVLGPFGVAVAEGPASLEDLPGGARESVVRLLAKTRRDHGEDATVIQTQLLLNALRNGSQLAAGVRIVGADDYHGRQYLRFHLETGLVFDDGTRDAEARVQMLWRTIMEPVLATIGEPDLAQTGIAVEMQAFHRPYSSAQELQDTIDNPGVSEEVTFYVLRDDLAELADGKLTTRDVFTHARITVDGSERTMAALPENAPTLPGPR